MSRRASRILHRSAGLVGAAGLFVLAATGLALLHPGWFGRPSLLPVVVAADPFAENRLLRAGPFLVEESLDGGATWQDLPLGLAPAAPVACRFAPADSGTVWLLGETELLVSSDGGRVWSPSALPDGVTGDQPPLDLAATKGCEVVLISEHRAWRGGNGRWKELWHLPRSRGDAMRSWLHRLHAGRWGPAWAVRLNDVLAVLTLVVLGSGLALLSRRNGGRSGTA